MGVGESCSHRAAAFSKEEHISQEVDPTLVVLCAGCACGSCIAHDGGFEATFEASFQRASSPTSAVSDSEAFAYPFDEGRIKFPQAVLMNGLKPTKRGFVNFPEDTLCPTDGHGLFSSLEDVYGIAFVREAALSRLSVPWPRYQELSQACNVMKKPTDKDVVVAVSHMWFFGVHPDPYGEKAPIVTSLLMETAQKLNCVGETLVFIDFLSIPQRSWKDGLRDRSVDESAVFSRALRSMPWVYLYADAVLALENTASEEDCSFPRETVEYGTRNFSKATDRGWIYLEHFIAMVKIAMLGDESGDSVIFSNAEHIKHLICSGGEALRVAAKEGQPSLAMALQQHCEILKGKAFQAISADKIENTGGVAGSRSTIGDTDVLMTIMSQMVAHLSAHWADEASRVRRHRFQRSVAKLNCVLTIGKSVSLTPGPKRELPNGKSEQLGRERLRCITS